MISWWRARRARRQLAALDTLVTGHEERDWKHTGICFIGYEDSWHLAYRYNGGFGYKWLPYRVQRFIVGLWNPVVCHFQGHDYLDEKALGIGTKMTCVQCCAEWET